MSLSDLAIRHAQPKDKEYKLFDSGGLFLAVRPTGAKIWRLKYYMFGKERKLTIGIYPVITLVMAREKRDRIKQDVIDGIDPAEVKAEQKRAYHLKSLQTFEFVAREWHKRNLDTWTPRYGAEILLRLENNVFPAFGSKQIAAVTIQDIIQCLHKIEDRGAYDMTRRILRIIGQILRYAVVTGRADRDVTPDLKGSLKKYKSGHYAAITSKELPEFLQKLNLNEARLFKQTLHAIKLLMLTFVRTTELIEAKWPEFDLENKIWTIPAERMKAKVEHQVPLSKQVLNILADLKKMYPNREYILPSVVRSNKPISNGTILKALGSMGYERKMTGHGFRSLAMSTIKENFDYRHEVIDRQLAHQPPNKIDKAYDRAFFLPQRITMMQDWADYLDRQAA